MLSTERYHLGGNGTDGFNALKSSLSECQEFFRLSL